MNTAVKVQKFPDMEILLFARPDADISMLRPALDRFFPGWRMVQGDIAPAKETLVLSFGGDGTFLDCVRRVGQSGMPILGVNSGRLGFLANVPLEDIEQAFSDLQAGKYAIESRPLLQADGDFEQLPDFPYAFNEFSLHRAGAEMIAVEVEVDGQRVATIWGDGVLVSTPSGSTAYSLSVGGPVVTPGCDCLVISPIAPHNLTMRPVVVPGSSNVHLTVRARRGTPYATLDNRTFPTADGGSFALQRAKIATNLIQLHNNSFYATLNEKMSWGTDKRVIFADR